jgi:hypothetical protein
MEKDGLDVTAWGKVRQGPFYRIWALDMPAKIQGRVIKPGGKWHMRIRGDKGAAYEAAAIVDETQLKYDLAFGSKFYRAGEALDLKLRIFAGGKPIPDDMQVTATVQVPSQSVGTLLAMQPLPDQLPDTRLEPQSTPGQRKLALLLQDERHRRSLQPVEHPATLKRVDEGVYRMTYASATVPGIYRVVVHIAGENPDLGSIDRTSAISTVVRFGKADLSASDLRIKKVKETDRAVTKAIYVKPRDTYGNFMGPDFGNTIQVELSEGTVADGAQDQGDGTYIIPIVVAKGADPKVTLALLGEVLFDGNLSTMPESADHVGPVKIWVYLAVALLIVMMVRLLWSRRRPA